MPNKSIRAGKSTREMANKRRQSALWTGLIGVAALVAVLLLLQNSKALGIGGTGILVLFVLLRIVPDLKEHTDLCKLFGSCRQVIVR